MAYFSNGSEGCSYSSRWCERCVHVRDCTVWLLHMLHNYDQFPEHAKTDEDKAKSDTLKSVLSTLIPNHKDSFWPAKCTMFHAATEAEIKDTYRDELPDNHPSKKPADWIAEWADKKGIKL